MFRLLPALSLLAACTGGDPSEPPAPGPLQAGVARVRMPVPVGIGTAGYGGFTVDADPSPFAELYPATQHVHGHPSFEAVVISRGEGHEIVFLRVDAVGMFQQFRRAVVLELRERLGRDLDDELVIGATHTHSGPGRVVDGGGIFDLIADRFFPEFYANMVDGMADAVEAAYADLRPARIGTAVPSTSAGHADRRCEDGETYDNGAMPMIAIERDGVVDALVVAYAVHGTVLGIDDLTLSQDVMGAMEQQIEDGFDHPVEVLMLNSWGADMAPGEFDLTGLDGAAQPGGYDRMEGLGLRMSDAVQDAMPALAWDDAPEIVVETHRFEIHREAIGYADGEFPYEYGGVYCGQSEEPDCDDPAVIPDLDERCVPFTAEYPAPRQTELTAGRVGGLHLITFPGEPGTRLAEEVIAQLRETDGVTDVMFVGYAQDYLGYSILEDDWWLGGYEAGGALWGPRQGEYLSARAVEAFERTFRDDPFPVDDLDEPLPVAPFGAEGFTPYAPAAAVDPGTVLADVAASYAPTDVVDFTVAGGDPWLGTPLAVLETEAGAPVTRLGGRPWDSDGYGFWVDLTTTPTYADALVVSERRFEWHFHMPVDHRVPGAPTLDGRYRLRVTLPMADGTTIEAVSAVFAVDR